MSALHKLLAAAVLCGLAVLPASAQQYPTRPVRMVVPFAPGGTSDIVGRVIARKLSELLGQSVIVDNRPGAGTVIGTDAVAKAAPDGYTILLATPDLTVNPSLQPKLPFDTLKDLAPVASIATYPLVLVANPSLPANSVKELIALAKAKPGAINFASGGNGSTPHLSGELFKSLAQVDLTHVPYKGNGPAITDLLGGQVQLLWSGMPPVAAHVKSGKLKAIAVTGKKRLASAPELPTFEEAGVPGYEVITWYGVLVPAGTPTAVVERLNNALAKAMESSEVKEGLASLGADLTTSTPEEYAGLLRDEIAKWAKVVKEAHIRID